MHRLLGSWRLLFPILIGAAVGTGCGGPTGTTVGQTGGGDKRIIILINGNSPFWDTCRAGLQEAEKHTPPWRPCHYPQLRGPLIPH